MLGWGLGLALFSCGAVALLLAQLGLILGTQHHFNPYVPSSGPAVNAIVASGLLDDRQKIVDLGCGSGTILARLSLYYPQAELVGVEHLSTLVHLCRVRFLLHSCRPTIVQGDMFSFPLGDVDAIVGFWLPEVGQALMTRFALECPPGCIVVNNLFPLPEHPNFEPVPVEAGPVKLYAYRRRSSPETHRADQRERDVDATFSHAPPTPPPSHLPLPVAARGSASDTPQRAH